MKNYDVVVLGLGGMGSAAAAHLARRGASVLGLEQFTPAHDRGSSHGDTRITRQAYFEHPGYVPLLQRAHELFEDLNQEDPGVYVPTGGLMMGPADSPPVTGTLASAQQWGLPHQVLDTEEIRLRYPNFRVPDGTVAVHEERAGFVRPERTVRAHLRRAAAAGADLRFEEAVLHWTARPGQVQVQTAAGSYQAGRLVICPGAWAPQQLTELHLPLSVERHLLFWFDAGEATHRFTPDRQPIFIWQTPSGRQLYGFPAVDGPAGGVKFAFYRNGSPAEPDALDRTIHSEETLVMREHLQELIPDAAGPLLRAVACMYTVTPDLRFVIGRHPVHESVLIAAGFSGHGFKFVPVVGEVLADLALEESSRYDLGMFDPRRFSA